MNRLGSIRSDIALDFAKQGVQFSVRVQIDEIAPGQRRVAFVYCGAQPFDFQLSLFFDALEQPYRLAHHLACIVVVTRFRAIPYELLQARG